MKIFLDTANLEEIKTAKALGLLDGVTTNPSLIAKEDAKFKERILEICAIVDGPVNAEVVALDTEGMLKEGRTVAGWAPNVVVKIPMTENGLRAVQGLSREGIRTNVTLVFSVNQAVLAAKSGATYVSPFVGRIDDAGQDGMEVVSEIVAAYRNYDITTEVLAASLRHPQHFKQAVLIGASIATIPYSVFKLLFLHPLTDAGLKKFLDDWEKARLSIE